MNGMGRHYFSKVLPDVTQYCAINDFKGYIQVSTAHSVVPKSLLVTSTSDLK